MTERGRRAAGDQGAAILEFAFVSILLLTLIFGIINLGLILSFKQDLTRAAAEGARAGAVAFPVGDAWAEADGATREAVTGSNQTCGVEGMTCNVNLSDCAVDLAPDTPSNSSSTGDCVTVELVYNYDDFPLLAKLPMIAPFLPDEIRARSVARTNS